jgi:hypothetical protein
MIDNIEFILAFVLAVSPLIYLRNNGSLAVATSAFLLFCLMLIGYNSSNSFQGLPWSGDDSENFYEYAIYLSKLSIPDLLNSFRIDRSYVYSYFISIFIRAFSSSYSFLCFINSIVSACALTVVYKSLILAGAPKRKALIAVLILFFNPVVLVLSSVLLRESFILLGLSIASYGFALMFRDDKRVSFNPIFYIIFGYAFAGLFHGIFFLIIFSLVAFYLCGSFQISLTSFSIKKLSIYFFIGLILTGTILSQGVSKIESFEAIVDSYSSRVERVSERGARGGSGYPSWITSNSSNALIYLPRILYYFLSPMPWEWRNLSDLIAFGLSMPIFLVFAFLVASKKARFLRKYLLFPVLLLVIFFALGTNNAGTALRHRFKLVPLLSFPLALDVAQRSK